MSVKWPLTCSLLLPINSTSRHQCRADVIWSIKYNYQMWGLSRRKQNTGAVILQIPSSLCQTSHYKVMFTVLNERGSFFLQNGTRNNFYVLLIEIRINSSVYVEHAGKRSQCNNSNCGTNKITI